VYNGSYWDWGTGPTAGNYAELNQDGDGNISYQHQADAGGHYSITNQSGTANNATTLQFGSGHNSVINQLGTGNVTTVTQND
jgi:hypothetical protein